MHINQLQLGNNLTHEYDPRLKKLTIRGATYFPAEILDYADDIEILDMSFGELSSLPDDFDRLHNLRVLFLSYTPFTEVPKILGRCRTLDMIGMKSCRIATVDGAALPPALRALTLTDNQLTALPAAIGKLSKLVKLMVAGNQLTDVPRELLQCENLDSVRISANKLTERPTWLLRLPKLAWYSDAGNPFDAASNKKLPQLPWGAVESGEIIGRSAKNTVYRGYLKESREAVAIKLFGGEISTDGYSTDEIRANVTAGEHPAIISGIAELTETPDNKPGMVLRLIPPHYKPVGLPPDLNTHTRDIYAVDTTFTVARVLAILQDTAAALQHIHSRGILHGDVYAHNLLADDAGHTYLGDFGGASFYDKNNQQDYEYIDVRAFGLLMEELLDRCPDSASNTVYKRLQRIQKDCLQRPDIHRPSFAKLTIDLQTL